MCAKVRFAFWLHTQDQNKPLRAKNPLLAINVFQECRKLIWVCNRQCQSFKGVERISGKWAIIRPINMHAHNILRGLPKTLVTWHQQLSIYERLDQINEGYLATMGVKKAAKQPILRRMCCLCVPIRIVNLPQEEPTSHKSKWHAQINHTLGIIFNLINLSHYVCLIHLLNPAVQTLC